MAAAAVLLALGAVGPAAGAVRRPQGANHCFTLGAAGRFYLKPTRLGAYLLYDRSRTLVSTRSATPSDPSTAGCASRRGALRPAARLLANVAREKNGHSALATLFHGAGAYLRTWRLTGAK